MRLACRHCGSRAGRARPDELSTAETLNLAQQLCDFGVKEVTLIGGEAYLRDDWLDVVSALTSRGVLCSLTTGGRGLTPSRIEAAIAAGLEGISVSVDGLQSGEDLIVTDRNRPVLRISRIKPRIAAAELFADVRGKVIYRGDIMAPIEDWNES
jgi:MoaA/NifB/PqqE/SkfB family radical SAM enzyme